MDTSLNASSSRLRVGQILTNEGIGDSVEVVKNWLPPTPSSGSTNSSFGVDWLEKNKRKCESCSKGNACCNRNFDFPCLLDCECALIEAWANLTVTDDHRRDKALTKKHEEIFPPLPRVSTDKKYVAAWQKPPVMMKNRQQWHSKKSEALKAPVRDRDGVNFSWQGWDHFNDFGTTSSNYGTSAAENQEKPVIKYLKHFEF